MTDDASGVKPRPAPSAWIDMAAFAGGLTMAWFAHWETRDLVWSLWLSSLLVGYAMIVWTVSAPLRTFARAAVFGGARGDVAVKSGAGVATGAGVLFMLGFFTLHFGMFHFVHSVFLAQFFPLEGASERARGFPSLGLYRDVFKAYWIFVPLALVAERAAFRERPPKPDGGAMTPAAIERRKREEGDSPLMAPYKNVVRLHLLIFFFAGAYALRLHHFAVYAVAYAAYFFPWRIFGWGWGKRAGAWAASDS